MAFTRAVILIAALSVVVLSASSCETSSDQNGTYTPPAAGTEGGVCREGGECNEGLYCASGYCVPEETGDVVESGDGVGIDAVAPDGGGDSVQADTIEADTAMDTVIPPEDTVCVPSCGDAVCGDDGCGGTCGTCEAGAFCVGGQCISECESQCTEGAHFCFDEGHIQFCVGYGEGCTMWDTPYPCEYGCANGQCKTEPSCVPACEGKECGVDGCGGTCGACAVGYVCSVGTCVADQPCPEAVITVEEGDEVIPGTVLHLSGSESFSPYGEIVVYSWSVEAPSGVQGVFEPSDKAPSPTFEVGTVGTYVFSLSVTDSVGSPSCEVATYTVVALSDEAIRIEVVWDTPGDPDQTDSGPFAGADLDLHFTHPSANSGYDLDGDGQMDPWFDNIYDCFWFSGKPNWGDPNSSDDDPVVELDDVDGAGPEIISLDIPEDDTTYRVGVHYWDDHDYGPSYATVKVYLYSVLALEAQDVSMVSKDMWSVATIDWPDGGATLSTSDSGALVITHDYNNPNFSQP